MKLTTHLHLKWRMTELYLHSPICLLGIVLNKQSTGQLHLYLLTSTHFKIWNGAWICESPSKLFHFTSSSRVWNSLPSYAVYFRVPYRVNPSMAFVTLFLQFLSFHWAVYTVYRHTQAHMHAYRYISNWDSFLQLQSYYCLFTEWEASFW
jgi:hypothetical protein